MAFIINDVGRCSYAEATPARISGGCGLDSAEITFSDAFICPLVITAKVDIAVSTGHSNKNWKQMGTDGGVSDGCSVLLQAQRALSCRLQRKAKKDGGSGCLQPLSHCPGSQQTQKGLSRSTIIYTSDNPQASRAYRNHFFPINLYSKKKNVIYNWLLNIPLICFVSKKRHNKCQLSTCHQTDQQSYWLYQLLSVRDMPWWLEAWNGM